MVHRNRWLGIFGGLGLTVGVAVGQPLPPLSPLPVIPPPDPLTQSVAGTPFDPIQVPPVSAAAPLPVPTVPPLPPPAALPTLDPNRVAVGRLVDPAATGQPPVAPMPTPASLPAVVSPPIVTMPTESPRVDLPRTAPAPLPGIPTLDPSRVIVGRLMSPDSGSVGPGNAVPIPSASPFPSPAVSPTFSAAPAAALPFEILWNNGLFVQTPNKEFVAHVGGVIQYDGAWYSGGSGVQTFPGGVGRFHDGVSPRRLRLLMDGSIHTNVDYKLEVEFNNGSVPAGLPANSATVFDAPGPLDVWVTLKQVPILGNVRIGNQKEWFSQEMLNSGRWLPFLERSYLVDLHQSSAFNNGRSPGVSAFRTWLNDRVFTGAGVYKNESNTYGFGLNDGEYAVTGRIGGLPVWDPDNQTYWHVGGAMSHRDPVDDAVRVRVRSQVRAAPFPLLNLVADTGAIGAESQTLYNLQSSAAYGPITVSSEYTANLIRGARVGTGSNLGTVQYDGWYTEALVFLTGEHREWDPKVGMFKRVIPRKNLSFADGTYGAVEVGTRYSYLDLDDRGVNGGVLQAATLGVTWYWNPNVRLQLNYDYMYRDGGINPLAKGSIHSLGTRLAMDF